MTMSNSQILPVVRQAWVRAQHFPIDKETVYPELAAAHEFDRHRGKKVLEYGCGGGSDTLSFLRRGCEVTYTDVVASNVEITSERVRVEGFGAVSSGMVLPESDRLHIDSGTFDVASSNGVIHHIPQPLPVLKEIRRVVKPHGLFYCMLYTETLWSRHEGEVAELVATRGLSEQEAFGWRTDDHGCPWSVFYTEDSGRALLESAGFKDVAVTAVYNRDEFRVFRAVAT